VPEELDDNHDTIHGYHRWCHSNFINVSKLKRMPDIVSIVEEDASYQPLSHAHQEDTLAWERQTVSCCLQQSAYFAGKTGNESMVRGSFGEMLDRIC